MRPAFGQALVDIGRERKEVVVLSADVSNSDHSYMFQETFPDRFFNVGIADQALVDIAVGFALTGKIPFVNTFAFLFATRALEMVRTHLCYGETNVKLMGAYAGLSDSFDGPTHHSITDIAIMRSLPNMTVVVPADPTALRKLLPQVADSKGPVFMRIGRNPVPAVFNDHYDPKLGKAHVLREGDDVSILCNGIMVHRSIEAARLLAEKNIETQVVEVHTVKPIDTDAVVSAAEKTGAIVTAEEHSVIGGLGAAVAETVTGMAPVPVKRVGIPDRFTETGPYEELLDKYGMAVSAIINACEQAVDMK